MKLVRFVGLIVAAIGIFGAIAIFNNRVALMERQKMEERERDDAPKAQQKKLETVHAGGPGPIGKMDWK